MRFDAYNCTFRPDAFGEVLQGLFDVLGAKMIPRNAGLHGYRSSQILEVDGSIHGVVAWGGKNRRPYVEVKGEPSQVWSEFVKSRVLDDRETRPTVEDALSLVDPLAVCDGLSAAQDWEPWASLTRADVCYDWLDDRDTVELSGGLRRAVDTDSEVVRRFSPSWDQRGDWMTLEGRLRGCTLYMGASSSAVRVRLYDKGLELLGRHIDADPRLRRLEVQYRPDGRDRERWATLEPGAFWLVSPAVRACARAVGISVDSDSPALCPKIPTTLERQKTILSVQYGAALCDMVKELFGSEAANRISLEIESRKADYKKASRSALAA